MILSRILTRILSVITVGMVFSYFRMILGWFERRFAPKYMKERVNSGSDKFFVDEEKNWGRTEIDSLVRGDFDNV